MSDTTSNLSLNWKKIISSINSVGLTTLTVSVCCIKPTAGISTGSRGLLDYRSELIIIDFCKNHLVEYSYILIWLFQSISANWLEFDKNVYNVLSRNTIQLYQFVIWEV